MGRVKILIFLMLVAFLSPTYCQNTPQDQIDALKIIYNDMGGTYWTSQTNWNNGDPCDPTNPWYGINCLNITIDNTTTSVVQVINLYDNNLAGSIPSNISALTYLEFLYLDSNDVYGFLPSVIWDLPLQKLSLSYNKIGGTIPSQISNLTNCYYLNFQSNSLSGSIPDSFYALTNLTSVYFTQNLFSGSISSNIQNLTNLNILYLSNNQFSGAIPDTLWGLTNLTQLALNTNSFSGSIPDTIGNLTKLITLDLSSNKITGTIPDQLFNLTSLQTLNLALNNLDGTISSSIGNLQQLSYLNIQSFDSPSNPYQFSGDLPESIWSLSKLTNFYISFNQFKGTISSQVGNMTSLQNFDLSSNLMTGTLPDQLFDLTTLQSLFIQENKFVGTLNGDLFSNLTQLVNVLLTSNQFSGTVPYEFFSTFHFTGSNILSDNPFFCPLPKFASAPPLSATCSHWSLSEVNPSYASIAGGQNLTITGTGYTYVPSNLYCSFSVSALKPNLLSPAVYLNSTAISCLSPANAPTSNETNFGVSIYYYDGTNSTLVSAPDSSLAFVIETTPSITSISPSNSMQYGGQLINVTGSDFANTGQFNALFCVINNITTEAYFVNTTFIYCYSPNLNATGIFSFAVTNDNGQNFSAENVTIEYYSWCQPTGNETSTEGEVEWEYCNNQGVCTNTTTATCQCSAAYSGESCTDCASDYYSSSCIACPTCYQGTCDDGVSGSGTCTCKFGWIGTTCVIPYIYIIIGAVIVLLIVGLIVLIITRKTRQLKKLNDQRMEERRLLSESKKEKKYVEEEEESRQTSYYDYASDNMKNMDFTINNNV